MVQLTIPTSVANADERTLPRPSFSTVEVESQWQSLGCSKKNFLDRTRSTKFFTVSTDANNFLLSNQFFFFDVDEIKTTISVLFFLCSKN